MQYDRPKVFTSTKVSDFSTASVTIKEVELAEHQDAARFVIRELGGFLPTLEDMKKEVDPNYVNTLPAIEARIKETKADYEGIISKLIRYHIQTISDEALDRYMQVDDLEYYKDPDPLARTTDPTWADYYSTLESYFRSSDRQRLMELKRDLFDVRAEYGRRIYSLYEKRVEAKKTHEEAEARRQLADFPKTEEAFNAAPKNVQLVVARFLMVEGLREMTQKSHGWSWVQTRALIDVYNSNQLFRTKIVKFVESNQSNAASTSHTQDPRKRK